jgi:hypothetical protein
LEVEWAIWPFVKRSAATPAKAQIMDATPFMFSQSICEVHKEYLYWKSYH